VKVNLRLMPGGRIREPRAITPRMVTTIGSASALPQSPSRGGWGLVQGVRQAGVGGRVGGWSVS
jgi:hypothetical protein